MRLDPPHSFDRLRFPVRSGDRDLSPGLSHAQGWDMGRPRLRPDPRPDFDPTRLPLCHGALAILGAATCLRAGLLPLRRPGGGLVMACADRAKARAVLTQTSAPLPDPAPLLARAAQADIQGRLLAEAAPALVADAEAKRAPEDSCRNLAPPSPLVLILAGGTALACGLVWPKPIFLILTVVAVLALAVSILLKLLAIWSVLAGRIPQGPPRPVLPAQMPRITLLLPMLHEPDVAARLITAIDRLDYPRHALEVLVLVEAEDFVTKAALDGVELPAHMRVIEVPPGQIKTKPRAMNYALPFATGEIIGVYDAEDWPEPDQLRKVAAQFATAPARVACLQGRLDYYNATANAMARCFTLDYAAWFRVMLPMLTAFDLPVPLGGTTVFLRREVLEALGGWDAHNVTEDAELGLRLYRHGYRVQLLDSTTFEEANCRPIPWVKQRSRWLKGYLVTWAVLMRSPRQLRRDMGWRGFLAFQALILGTLVSCATAPVLWSFVPGVFGHPHALFEVLPPWAIPALLVLLVAGQGATIAVFALGAALRRTASLIPWIPVLNLYFMLATPAMFKALWETAFAPHHWDKTEHGIWQAPDGGSG